MAEWKLQIPNLIKISPTANITTLHCHANVLSMYSQSNSAKNESKGDSESSANSEVVSCSNSVENSERSEQKGDGQRSGRAASVSGLGSLRAAERADMYRMARRSVVILVSFSQGTGLPVMAAAGTARRSASNARLISRMRLRSRAFAVFLRYLLRGWGVRRARGSRARAARGRSWYLSCSGMECRAACGCAQPPHAMMPPAPGFRLKNTLTPPTCPAPFMYTCTYNTYAF